MACFRILLIELVLVRLKHLSFLPGAVPEFSHVGNVQSKVPA